MKRHACGWLVVLSVADQPHSNAAAGYALLADEVRPFLPQPAAQRQ
jgi:hypothetical protein